MKHQIQEAKMLIGYIVVALLVVTLPGMFV